MSNQSRQGYVLHAPLSELSEVLALEERLLFDKFGVKEIQEIGDNITKAIEGLGKPVSALVDISLVNGPTSVFRRIASSGYNERPVHFGLDNEQWVVRKRNTVIRWGTSTWAANRKYGGDEEAFARRFMLGWGAENAAKYAIHGGGFPVRIKDVVGIVAVITVTGLTQEEDHQVIVQTVYNHLQPSIDPKSVLKICKDSDH